MPDTDDHQPDAPPPPAPTVGESPFAEHLQPPRLGIIHLLAWTGVMAVLLKYGQAMEMLQADTESLARPTLETAQSILRSAYAAVGAAGLVGAAVLLMTKIRRTPGNFQPGHWILLINSAAMLMSYLNWSLLVLLRELHPADFTWHFLSYALIGLFHAGGYLVATWQATAPRRWKAYFLLRVLVLLLQSLALVVAALIDEYYLLSRGWSLVWSASVGIGLLAVVLFDLMKQARRDWLHWTGVAIVATVVLLQVGWWIALKWIEP